ncbi:MAG: LysR family transcriptional regulator [Alphaproteobacteria bacterium]|nr:LysR family transcriptional regulator [Alphaproteobacteria bacterium]
MRQASWDGLKSFLSIAEHGSLTHAADDIGLSVATLGRRIDALEAALGLTLMRRGPKGATLTDHGMHIRDLVKSGAEHFDQLERIAKALSSDVASPPVRISSTEPMIADVLAPAIPLLLSSRPGLQIELETSLELSNLNRGDADIAIRMVKPKGDTLIARKLPPIRMGLFAEASYLAGRPSIADLSTEHLVWYDSAYGDIAENLWLKRQKLESRIAARSGSVRALLRMAQAGVGIAPLPVFLAQAAGLQELPKYPLPDRMPWLVFHRASRTDERLKAVRDWIETACKQALAVQ